MEQNRKSITKFSIKTSQLNDLENKNNKLRKNKK